jgi:hypothetical protein
VEKVMGEEQVRSREADNGRSWGGRERIKGRGGEGGERENNVEEGWEWERAFQLLSVVTTGSQPRLPSMTPPLSSHNAVTRCLLPANVAALQIPIMPLGYALFFKRKERSSLH